MEIDKEAEAKQNQSCLGAVGSFLKKYFCEGQSLRSGQETAKQNLPPDAPWYRVVMVKYRRVVAFFLPVCLAHFFWWGVFIRYNLFYLFKEKWYMSVTMIFGSLIAGMTSEGGGSVAYPVLTLGFNIDPSIARDVSFMVQTFGMSCASFTILFMRVHIDWFSLIFCSMGGVVGLTVGLSYIDPLLPKAYKKMAFVCIWFTFAFALYLLNRYRGRTTFKRVPDFKLWKAIVLIATGLVGGIFTSFAGGGLDICSFSVLTLLFRVSEKTATPTSVILMATNSQLGIYWRQVIQASISREAWEFGGVTAPIVTIGAPFGALIGSHFHRLVLATCNYVTDTTALIIAFIVVKQTPALIGVSVGIIVFGFLFFFSLTKIGERMLNNLEKKGHLGDDQELDVVANPNVVAGNNSNDPVCLSHVEKGHATYL